MRLLLDTHAFLWWLAGDEQLSPSARRAIADQDNDVFVSAASAWEIATKYRIGKLPAVTAIVADIDRVLLDQSFVGLPISIRHGQAGAPCPDHTEIRSIVC